jgi:hypothetical protein
VAWLRADLAAWGEEEASRAATAARTLGRWRVDPDLAGIRDAGEVAGLPPEEQEACRSLWSDVDALLRRVREAAEGVSGTGAGAGTAPPRR